MMMNVLARAVQRVARPPMAPLREAAPKRHRLRGLCRADVQLLDHAQDAAVHVDPAGAVQLAELQVRVGAQTQQRATILDVQRRDGSRAERRDLVAVPERECDGRIAERMQQRADQPRFQGVARVVGNRRWRFVACLTHHAVRTRRWRRRSTFIRRLHGCAPLEPQPGRIVQEPSVLARNVPGFYKGPRMHIRLTGLLLAAIAIPSRGPGRRGPDHERPARCGREGDRAEDDRMAARLPYASGARQSGSAHGGTGCKAPARAGHGSENRRRCHWSRRAVARGATGTHGRLAFRHGRAAGD